VLFLVAFLSAVFAGKYSDTLTFTGNVENDFATNSGNTARKGVLVLPDASFGGGMRFDDPDVGLPPGMIWQTPAGRVSGWDIKNIYFQLDFEYAVFFFFFFLFCFFCRLCEITFRT
jgi:hypothetical protein